jgi:hypothetical protein
MIVQYRGCTTISWLRGLDRLTESEKRKKGELDLNLNYYERDTCAKMTGEQNVKRQGLNRASFSFLVFLLFLF